MQIKKIAAATGKALYNSAAVLANSQDSMRIREIDDQIKKLEEEKAQLLSRRASYL